MRTADNTSHRGRRSVRQNGLTLRELIATLAVAATMLFVIGEVQKGRERSAYQTSENTYRLAISELETRIENHKGLWNKVNRSTSTSHLKPNIMRRIVLFP